MSDQLLSYHYPIGHVSLFNFVDRCWSVVVFDVGIGSSADKELHEFVVFKVYSVVKGSPANVIGAIDVESLIDEELNRLGRELLVYSKKKWIDSLFVLSFGRQLSLLHKLPEQIFIVVFSNHLI